MARSRSASRSREQDADHRRKRRRDSSSRSPSRYCQADNTGIIPGVAPQVSIGCVSTSCLQFVGEGGTKAETPPEKMTGKPAFPGVKIAKGVFLLCTMSDSHRYRSRDDGREERYPSKHRSDAEDRRGGNRGGQSARNSNPYGDRPQSRANEGKTAAEGGVKATDKSLTVAAEVAEAPKQRAALKPGPAGGAYIPPFRLLQVCMPVQ